MIVWSGFGDEGDGEGDPVGEPVGEAVAEVQASGVAADDVPTEITAGSATTAPAHRAPTAETAAVRRKREAMKRQPSGSRTGSTRPYPGFGIRREIGAQDPRESGD